eukprot:s1542_g15.t1
MVSVLDLPAAHDVVLDGLRCQLHDQHDQLQADKVQKLLAVAELVRRDIGTLLERQSPEPRNNLKQRGASLRTRTDRYIWRSPPTASGTGHSSADLSRPKNLRRSGTKTWSVVEEVSSYSVQNGKHLQLATDHSAATDHPLIAFCPKATKGDAVTMQ